MTVEIEKMITLSTGHIQASTAEYLNQDYHDTNLVVYEKDEFGWFISLDSEYIPEMLKTLETPADLAQVIAYALDHGCTWLALDVDGQELEELPTYEW
jgi:hypothetical protein